jgi:hypothetical protein
MRRDKQGPASWLDDPFVSEARRTMPTNIVTAFDYCLRLYMDTPMYRAVTNRAIAHFVQKLVFRGNIGSPKERERFEEFFTEELLGMEALKLLGQEYNCYGNGFLRVNFPFTRVLVDRRDDIRILGLSTFPEELVKFDLATMTYNVPDPKDHRPFDQRKRIDLPFRDRPSRDFSKIRLRVIDPRFCRLRYCETSGATQVEYLFKPETRSRVKAGELFTVNRTPAAMLNSMRLGQGFLFNEDALHHMRAMTISGISNDGWGLPEILAHYPAIHRIHMIQRVDDFYAKETLTPFRIVAPNLAGLGNMESMSLAGEWMPATSRLFDEQRQDPYRIHAFPFPMLYQEMGGDGKNRMPKDIRELEIGGLFNSLGMPAELFNASLQTMQVPMAIRLFENSFSPMSFGLSMAARFAVDKISKFMYGEAYNAALEKPSIADDMERRGLLFNLYSAQEIPGRLAFSGLSLGNAVDLKIERAQEELEAQRRLAALQKEEERKAQMGSIDDSLNMADEQAAQQQQQAPGGPVTPLDVRAEAEQIAQQWLAIESDGERAKAMKQVESVDEAKYAMAKEIMDKIRRQGASEGRQQAAAQFRQ